ncbi:MAG TPA: cysteine synthase A [Symbiobacteriaceae bacterium]|nr:cysteine synthase A [Symbiobacteriaceae bacterium]
MRVYDSIADVIGNTPHVRLNRVVPPGSADVYVKLEWFNPGRSVKDRAAANMIARAEAEGKLIPAVSTIIEPTSGNTGIGLAMAAAAKGYRLIITMPDNATLERIKVMKAYGAAVHLTPAAQRMNGAIERAEKLAAEIPHSFIPQQFENPANPDAHRGTTAREILDAFGSDLHALVLTAGTGGTVTGTGEELKKALPHLKIYVVEAKNSPVLAGGKPGPHKIVGTGPGFIPKILNTGIWDQLLHIEDHEATQMARRLGREEGMLLGASGAASVFFALRIARELGPGKRVLAIAPDSGERYLSSDLFE